MVKQVCVDASIVLMLLVPEKLSPKARAIWRLWFAEEFEIVAPPLFFAEVTSVLREHVFFERALPEDAERAFGAFMRLPIKQMDMPDLQPQAWAAAGKYGRPRAYDAQYLAVATMLRCELWTGDKRLVNVVKEPWLKWVGDYAAPT